MEKQSEKQSIEYFIKTLGKNIRGKLTFNMIRSVKRLVIIFIYFSILALILTALYFVFKPAPNCFDNQKNQGEEGVDCGGPCSACAKIIQLKPIEIKNVESTKAIKSREQRDLITEIHNPNQNYGSSEFLFRFISDKGTALSDWQSGFILPEETKHLVGLNIVFPDGVKEVGVELDQVNSHWERFVQYVEPKLAVINKKLELDEDKKNLIAKGTLFNQSKIDFEKIKIKVFLYDEGDKLLAVNTQSMNTVRAGERRDYLISFDKSLSRWANKMKVEAETNVFNSDNYLRVYGKPQKSE